ncbi:TOMM precursor leader peptide-binding protein [Sorangium sp. So ce834]|uniref:TOMM precursor leader peptide-binding protein n=1 Tax=Sorangium sp. So ce834 TaxID=3133321 RepID=UPI003F5E2583
MGVILRSDLGTFQVTGASVGAFLGEMVPRLDGTRDREALVEALDGYSRRSITDTLALLEKHGLVEVVPEGPISELRARLHVQEEFFRKWQQDAAAAVRRLAEARVLCVALSPAGAAAAHALEAAGVGEVLVMDEGALGQESAERTPERGHLLVAAVAPEDRAPMERITRISHRAKLPSLWAQRAGERLVIGPLVTPGQTACRVCAAVEALNVRLDEGTGEEPPPERSRILDALLGQLLALEALKVLSGYTPTRLGGRVLVQDRESGRSSLHTLVRLPWCRVCGQGA